MSISKSLYTGLSGLVSHQRSLDNTGNNLANVNTTGYKQSTYSFTNLLTQVMSGNLSSTGGKGGTTGTTVGSGVTTGAITTTFGSGSIDPTGNTLDLAISGNGFFLVNTGQGQALTRNGSFYFGDSGSGGRSLLVGDGNYVQGWMAQNGIVTPSSTATTNITIPAIGDVLAGNPTSQAALKGVLPTGADADLSGTATTTIELKGNVASGSAVYTTISVPVTTTRDGTTSTAMQDIRVQIAFDGPASGGNTDDYAWTMTTVDWPSAGDAPIQLYPTAATSASNNGSISFHAQANSASGTAAGQVAGDKITLGSTSASVSSVQADGSVVDTSLSISSSFTLDISRLTNLAEPPAGSELEVWSVDGNPDGSMASTITVYDEVVRFEAVENADGTVSMRAVTSVEKRENKLTFSKTSADNSGSTWSWSSSMDGAGGALRFDTGGQLVSATGGGGSIAYDFSGVQSVNHAGSIACSAQDGYEAGYLADISIDEHGHIYGHYSNDVVKTLALIAMATVPNATGLQGGGGTLFYPSASSGEIMIGIAGDEDGSLYGLDPIGAGTVLSGFLESSNVDSAKEFTTLISTQRGYQFSARIVTTADEMLQTLIQMKR